MRRKVTLLISVIMLFSALACGVPVVAEDEMKADITLTMYAYDPDKNVVDFTKDLTGQTLTVGDVVAIVPVLKNLSNIATHGVFHFSYAFNYDITEMKQMLFAPGEMVDTNAAQNPIIKQGLASPLDVAYDVEVSTFHEPDPNKGVPQTEKIFQMVFNYIGDKETLNILKDNADHDIKLGAYPFEVISQSDEDGLALDVKEDEKYTTGLKLQEEGTLNNLQPFRPKRYWGYARPQSQKKSRQPVVTGQKDLDVDGNYRAGSKIIVKTFADGSGVTASTTVAMYEDKTGTAVQTVTAVEDTENGGYKIEFPLTTGQPDKTYYFAAQEAGNYAWSEKVVLPADNITKPDIQAILDVDTAKALTDTDLSTDMTPVEKAAIHNSGLPATMSVPEGTTKAELFDYYLLNQKVTVQLVEPSVYYIPPSKYTAIPVEWDIAEDFVVQKNSDGTNQIILKGKFDAASLKSQGISPNGVVTTETQDADIQETDLRPTIVISILSKSRMPFITEDNRQVLPDGTYAPAGYVSITKFVDGTFITANTKIYLYDSLNATEPVGETNGYTAEADGANYKVMIPFTAGEPDQTWYFAAVEGDSFLESDRTVLLKQDLIDSKIVEVEKALSKSEVANVSEIVLTGMPHAELLQFQAYGLPEYIIVPDGITVAELFADYGLQRRVSIQLKEESIYYDPAAKYSVVGVNWLKPKNDTAETDAVLEDTDVISFGETDEITLSGNFNENELTARALKLAEDTQMPTIKLLKISKSAMPKLEPMKNLTAENKYGVGANVTVKELVDGTKIGETAVLYVYENAADTEPIATINAESDDAGGYKITYPFTEGADDRNWYFSIDMGPSYEESDKALLATDAYWETAPNIEKILTDAEVKDTETITDTMLGGMLNVTDATETFRDSGLVAEVSIQEGSTLQDVKKAIQEAVSVKLTGPSAFYDPNTSYAAIPVDWDLTGYQETMEAGDTLNVTGTFNALAMQNKGIKPAEAPDTDPQPTLTLKIVAASTDDATVTLTPGNTTEAIEGDSYNENDIVVYYKKKFKDTGFTAVDPAGNDVTNQITRSIKVKVWKDLPVGRNHAFPIKEGDTTFEEVTFTKEAGSDVEVIWEEFAQNIVAGTYTMEYKLGDNVLETRNVHVRYQRADINLDGSVNAGDISDMVLHALTVTETVKHLNDERFFVGYMKYVGDVNRDGSVNAGDISDLVLNALTVTEEVQHIQPDYPWLVIE